ncbi:GNAT family N-acetyltransferase [Amphiplicatus metriothermophilus]|uniref:Acetyltransferase (GNAT) family protein n=1 Tax=Amphiplicatus metriothermophilus TaxID=1519374 RepID=A0A239PIS5_9PROT|nr:GNAT family N-acetyltransferase [Amphiplicatus metriothermophilus]MBB5517988.1 GNAT superfamily N-acetyltransferase [Amphiplicatus metriothermophilus]SNT67678.1 Acetyltransferase (GNAT) family protein [Amphiplicatus metriothermophilus]
MVRASAKPAFAVHPLTAERWADLETVFGPTGGYCGCWCMYWRAPRRDFENPEARKQMKARFRRRVRKGPPPGLIAYACDGEPVGWMQLTPRPDAPNWNGPRRLSAPLDPAEGDDPNVWAINCFVVRRRWRRKGVARALLGAGIDWARKNGARCIDACPVETAENKPAVSLYHGTAAMFARAGFVEIARRRGDRPLVRLRFGA